MNKLPIIFLVSFLSSATLTAEMYEPEDPIVWNGWNIARHYELYERGIGTREDLKAAIEQAYNRHEEEEAKTSLWVWMQEYYPSVPYLACVALGAGTMWAFK